MDTTKSFNIDSLLHMSQLQTLEQQDYVQIPNSDQTIEFLIMLTKLMERWLQGGTLNPALITQDHLSNNESQNQNIRNDFTLWLSDALTQKDLSVEERSTIQQLQHRLNATTDSLKQYFRFPLNSYESHFAAYPVGHSYSRHCDQTKSNNRRYFSFVIYLNSDWKTEHGGELVLYPEKKDSIKILPQIENMIVFKSHLEHEVKTGTRPRFSITGWFRND